MNVFIDLGTTKLQSVAAGERQQLQLQSGYWILRSEGNPLVIAEGAQIADRRNQAPGFLITDENTPVYTASGTVTVFNPNGVDQLLYVARARVVANGTLQS